MASKDIGVDNTIGGLHSNIRVKTSNEGISRSLLTVPSITNFIHSAIQSVVTLAGKSVGDFYQTEGIFYGIRGDAYPLYDVSDVNFASRRDPRVTLSATGDEVTYLTASGFIDQLNTWKDAPELQAAMFCCVTELEVSGTLQTMLKAFFGSAVGLSTPTLQINYTRNPRKVIDMTKRPDCPPHLIPAIVDWAVYDIFMKSAKRPPMDVSNRVAGLLRSVQMTHQVEQTEAE